MPNTVCDAEEVSIINSSYSLSDLAIRSAYSYIIGYSKRFGKPPSGLLFNKFMILLNRRLIGLGADMKLPHCWYRWGDEVVSYAFRDHVLFNHENLQYTSVSWIGAKPVIDKKSPYQSEIDSYVGEFLDNYSTQEGSEDVLDDVYSKVPYRFQNEYRKVRENLRLSLNSQIGNSKTMLRPLFTNAMSNFPKAFSELAETVRLYSRVFLKAIDSDAPFDVLFYLSEDFWFYFCYHLRLKRNYNVSRETLEIWRSVIPEEDERFEWRLQDMAAKYLSDEDDPQVGMILGARNRRLSEFDSMVDSLPDIAF